MTTIQTDAILNTVFDVAEAKLGLKIKSGQNFYNKLGSDSGNQNPIETILGGTVYKLKNGQRLPMNQQTNNPNLEMPSKLAMTLFGQSPIFKIAMDQIVPKPIGVFSNATQGAGLTGFNLANLPVFSGPMQLTDAIAKIMTGGSAESLVDSLLVGHIKDVVSQVSALVGASPSSLIELNNIDHVIPFMTAFSTVLGGGSAGFSSDIFKTGMTLANEVTSHLTSLAGGAVAYGKILDSVGSAALGAVTSATGNVDILGGVVGALPIPPVVKQGTEILAHIVKAGGQF